ncbi:hypothetical protein [Pseudanabaena sp. FACHB-2040]|uniref:hypothetical protein n=1 Tax=Pseudanabaena sp. FACHB-2040 TaxID=2692859 RepID=UPI00168472F4|nr:hypothetical protein [Pseudanabaena sp. FACHB-2040]MBD2257645.1 hypothetical protein [Pseudanabaena sp. FACHB-2040]
MENSATLLDWISVVGPIIFSWPFVIFVAVLIFRQPLLKLLENFSETNINKAKIGPVEIQEDLTPQSENVEFIINSFVTDYEFDHLSKLNGPDPFFYKKNDHLLDELKRLCNLSLIESIEPIETLPADGDLKETVEITEKGKQYLHMRKELSKSKG